MKVLLLSTYELGRQPFGLASPAAWLRKEGASVTCLDLARQKLVHGSVASADLIAFYIPMHTATRLAAVVLERVKQINPAAHVCFYGLYAPMNEDYLRKLGGQTILGGEFEEGLAGLVRRLQASGNGHRSAKQPEPLVSLNRQRFLVPDRADLPALGGYAKLNTGNGRLRTVGYTEASRGCKHLCRHCPVVPVYQGRFLIVQPEVVLEDVRRQVAAGAEHITFGDPDFFNGPRHALAIVKRLHAEFPALTYDVTVKIEHLLKHADLIPVLRDTGCLFVTSAVESADDRVLALLEKGHTREDFLRAVALFREAGLALSPTFVPFTPWTTLEGYLDLLQLLAGAGLMENVAPIQLAIRLLIPAGSRLLELPEVQELAGPFDQRLLTHRWEHSDPRLDTLQRDIQEIVKKGEDRSMSRRRIFERIWDRAQQAAELPAREIPRPDAAALPRAAVPYLNEPWYC